MSLNRFFIIPFFIFFINIASVFAVDYTSQINKCLGILANEVNNTYGISITGVNIDGNDTDLSVYTGIKSSLFTKKYMSEVLSINNDTKGCEYGLDKDEVDCKKNFSHVFFAKRNNIGTVRISPDIEGEGYWTTAEFVKWGGDVSFQFPLKKRDDPQYEKYGYYDEGDDYGILKRNIVYIQYLLDGTFSSCGFINFNAEGSHTLNDLYQRYYKGNDFEGGSFENIGDFEKGLDKFRGMKVKIVGLDWDDTNLFNMNVLSISYKNDDPFFSEYVAHRLQEKSMLNIKNQEGSHSMNKVIGKYIDYLIHNSCFKIVHKSSDYKVVDPESPGNTITYIGDDSLPGFCAGDYASKSDLVSYLKKNLFKGIFNKFVSPVYAYTLSEEDSKKARKKMESLPNPEVNGIDVYLWKKIDSLKDGKLKSFFIRALVPGSKALINHNINSGKYVSYNDIVFYKCGLKHDQIVENIKYLFAKYYKNGLLIIPDNVKYPNPDFGDCIIPYPDVRHKTKLITNSFLDNKLKFIRDKFGSKKVDEYEKKINDIKQKYIDKINKLKKEYNLAEKKKDLNLKSKIKKNLVSTYNNMQNDIINLEKNDKEFSKYISIKKVALNNVPVKKIIEHKKILDKHSSLSYIFLLVGLLLIILFLILIFNKNKNENKIK